MLSLSPLLVSACEDQYAFDIGSKAIETKYPEWRIDSEKFKVDELEEKWMIVRKEYVYEENPREYPRAYVSKIDCKVERIFWSK